MSLIWVFDEAKYFSSQGWTEFFKNCPSGKSAKNSQQSAANRDS
jgi:hypothetical protein